MATLQTTHIPLLNTPLLSSHFSLPPTRHIPLVFLSIISLLESNMPANIGKHAHKESTRQRESRENIEADKRNRDSQKAAAKVRKARCEEAADEDLLVEHEGESPELTKL
jgi:hypothetical protein